MHWDLEFGVEFRGPFIGIVRRIVSWFSVISECNLVFPPVKNVELEQEHLGYVTAGAHRCFV